MRKMLLLLLCGGIQSAMAISPSVRNIKLDGQSDFQLINGTMVSKSINPEIAWKECVPSWDVSGTESGGRIEVFIETAGRTFGFGHWSASVGLQNRSSLAVQKTDAGYVDTDTLLMLGTGGELKVKVRLFPNIFGDLPKLNHFHLAFWAYAAPASARPAPIAPLDVPIRAQGDYPGGNVLCSPTSVSMVLSYWAKQLNRPAIDHDVPAVKECVFDPAWNGTGNWAFNASFAASLPGISAHVARLENVSQIRELLEKGIPVITSVSYGLLKGKPARDDNDGHLVVLVGVDAQGNLIFNDPGKKPIRLTYDYDAFVRAWAVSNNTVYIIHPELWNFPDLP
ncbi:MAG: C39 family peptidase [Armatimonadetes bacterium]|nr:C39 family peptidase [Armatimonadota bacterium]